MTDTISEPHAEESPTAISDRTLFNLVDYLRHAHDNARNALVWMSAGVQEGAKLDTYAVGEAIRHVGSAADAINAILEDLQREGVTTEVQR